jgi:hypothetical protein
VLVYASAPPARLQLRRWDQVPHFRRLVEGGDQAAGSQRRPSPAPSARVGRVGGEGGC